MADTPFSDLICQKIISQKLKTNENFNLVNYQQIFFETVNGFLGDHSQLYIKIKKNLKEETHRFFVKSLPRVESQRNFVLEINGFQKEKFFFRKYLDLLQEENINILENIIPVCYYTNGEVFVFEDLTLTGYQTLSSRNFINLNCAKSALKSLAKLHASAIILEETKSIKLNQEFEEEFTESFYSGKPSSEKAMSAIKTGFDALIDLTHNSKMKISKNLLKLKISDGCSLQKIFVKPSTKFRNTLCHADLWTKNVMFKFKENQNYADCIIIDFQSFRYAPPAQDVVSFLHLTVSKDLRRKYMRDLLKFYYDELNENFGNFGLHGIITEDEFFESCDYYQRFVLTQTCSHFQVVTMSDEIASDLMAKPEQTQAVLFEDKYNFILECCQKDEIFKKLNFDALEELKEFYENQNC